MKLYKDVILNYRFDDVFFVCCIIEHTARKTKNKRGKILNTIGRIGLLKELKDAEISHCLAFDRNVEDWVENYKITEGDFDTISNCKYFIPSSTDIGYQYARLIQELNKGEEISETFERVFDNFLSDRISNFNSSFFSAGLDYLVECYLDNAVLN